MKPYRRRLRLLADWKLQGNFCLRVCGYWLTCQLVLVLTILGFLGLAGPSDSESFWTFIIPAVVASSLFLPIALLDNLRSTNKLIGPLMRLRREMESLAEGEKVSKLRFRPGDYLDGMDDQFNAILSRIEYLERANHQRIEDKKSQSVELTTAIYAD